MPRYLILTTALLCAACAAQPASRLAAAQPASETASDCREYTVPVIVGGQQQQAFGTACQQPDGSWRITQNTPGLPPQTYVVPVPPDYLAPYAWDYWGPPWSYAPPLFLGGSVFIGSRFHHFHDHDFHRGHDFHHADGFHRGFHEGFHGGGHGGFHGGSHGGGHR